MTDERSVPEIVHELGSHFDVHSPWLFLSRNGKGQLVVLTNRTPDEARRIARSYARDKA